MSAGLLRRAATGALLILLLLDALAYYEFWRYGPPIVANDVSSPKPGEVVAKLSRLAPSAQDWAALGLLVVAHLVVVCLIWYSRRRVRAPA